MTAEADDPRLTPARRDLAAAFLQGRVAAERFVAGAARVVGMPVADVRRLPRSDAPLDTQALHGEPVTVFDEREGWSWVQLGTDGYVGYVASEFLAPPAAAATHRVVATRTFVYPAADMKSAVLTALPLGALVAVAEDAGSFCRLAAGGFVFAAHLAAVATPAADFVATAERLIHVPYLWGGRSPLGIDCSGLVQLSLGCCGLEVPRDTDLQELAMGQEQAGEGQAAGDHPSAGRRLQVTADLGGLRRGDLVFWRGHVGVMRDGATLLHANAHHMQVASEPLRQAVERIGATGASISSICRLIER